KRGLGISFDRPLASQLKFRSGGNIFEQFHLHGRPKQSLRNRDAKHEKRASGHSRHPLNDTTLSAIVGQDYILRADFQSASVITHESPRKADWKSARRM